MTLASVGMRARVMIVILLSASALGCNQRPGEAYVNGNERGVRNACEEFVRDTLRAPKSAEFLRREQPAMLEPGRWHFADKFDAQNALGVKLRGSYICDVQFIGDGKYRLIALQLE